MTSKLMRARGKELAQPSNKRSLLTRGLWKALLGLVLMMGLVTVMNAQAPTPTPTPAVFNNSVLIGRAGINNPRGMVLARVPNPAAPGTFITDWWVSD
ncbi:MAG TPA: hypothetical protein VN679_03905, partial [Candidatus Acidoferrales bacterium]|nr:hypothetical protein [Candidatus Acidoferrales bacterium]